MKDDCGNKEIFSKNLKVYIEMTGKSRNTIADELKLSYSTFNSWCRGEFYPRIDKIELLADYFGCTKSDLIEADSDDEQSKRNVIETFTSKQKQQIIDFVANCDAKQTELLLLFINTMKGENNEQK